MNTVIKAFLPNYLRILLNLGNFKMKFVKWKGENQNSHLLKKQLRIIINLNNKSLKKMTHLK